MALMPADEPLLPRYLSISAHAELRMIERDVLTADLFAVRRDDPLLEWQRGGDGLRIRMIGVDLQRRLLTVILDLPDEDRMSAVITVFDASEADQRRYRRHKRRRSRN